MLARTEAMGLVERVELVELAKLVEEPGCKQHRLVTGDVRRESGALRPLTADSATTG